MAAAVPRGVDAGLDEAVVARLKDFISGVFAHVPGKRIELGRLLARSAAEDHLMKCRDEYSSHATRVIKSAALSKLLQRVRSEFDKYGKAVQTAYNRATRTVDAISKLQTRQNVMGRALKGVDLLSADTPLDAATLMLDFETRELEESEDGDGETQSPSERMRSGRAIVPPVASTGWQPFKVCLDTIRI